jgi:hypothetical protein
MQSVPITTKVVSSNHAHGEVYSIQLYVIKFVSDLWQVGGFLHYQKWSPRYNWNSVETGVKHHTSPPHYYLKLTSKYIRYNIHMLMKTGFLMHKGSFRKNGPYCYSCLIYSCLWFYWILIVQKICNDLMFVTAKSFFDI